jgi:Rrf2 family protein
MITINRQTEYALFLISYLSGRKKPVPLAEIGQKTNLSPQFLSKVAIQLKKKKILKSKEGRSGGYTLAVKPEKISLARILMIFEAEKRIVSCLEKKKLCVKNCYLREFWANFEKKLWQQCREISLAEIDQKQKLDLDKDKTTL